MSNFTTATPKIELQVKVLTNGNYQANIYEINSRGQLTYRDIASDTPANFETTLSTKLAAITPAP